MRSRRVKVKLALT